VQRDDQNRLGISHAPVRAVWRLVLRFNQLAVHENSLRVGSAGQNRGGLTQSERLERSKKPLCLYAIAVSVDVTRIDPLYEIGLKAT